VRSKRATLSRHIDATVCDEDVDSHKFPLFRCEAEHTSDWGKQLWWAVANPRHSVAWLCVKDPSTRVTG
ncbi:hypothetical protein SK128_001684, partial [Halocaridina rubra]